LIPQAVQPPWPPEYRAAVEQLTKLLMEVPGRLGKTVRIMDAGHTLLVKVL
jgi:antibiotic biosynthesis monooxygenase (ABM) superfamily enzyme